MSHQLEAETSQTSSAVSTLASHPIGVWFIFWGEFAERCSYYGMRASLTLYFVDILDFSKSNAGTCMSLFIAASYFLPLIGWAIAGQWGRYRTLVAFSLPYIASHLLLGIESVAFTIFALLLLAMGSGVIKPNISTLMGMTYDQRRPSQTELREAGFYWFYFAINAGAGIAQFGVPAARDAYGYGPAFMLPAVLMVFAFALFATGKPFYANEMLANTDLTNMDCSVFGKTVSADAIQGCNPLFILGLLPPIRLLWNALGARGIVIPATRKMLAGFVLTAACMLVMAMAATMAARTGSKVTVWWQIGAYLLLTIAEILISVTGLELAYRMAPAGTKSLVTGVWWSIVGVANLAINAQLTRLYPLMPPLSYFALLAVLLVIVSAAFFWITRNDNLGCVNR